jgi:hypothetical protein
LHVFEKKDIAAIYGPMEDDVGEEFMMQHTKKLRDLYISFGIARKMKCKGQLWDGDMTRMTQEMNT